MSTMDRWFKIGVERVTIKTLPELANDLRMTLPELLDKFEPFELKLGHFDLCPWKPFEILSILNCLATQIPNHSAFGPTHKAKRFELTFGSKTWLLRFLGSDSNDDSNDSNED